MKGKRAWALILCLMLVMVGVGGCGGETPESIAYKEAIRKVEMSLKAPSTAKFGAIEDTIIKKDYDSDNYYAWGYVDAKNPMGVELRTEYIVKVKIEDNVCISSEIIKLE